MLSDERRRQIEDDERRRLEEERYREQIRAQLRIEQTNSGPDNAFHPTLGPNFIHVPNHPVPPPPRTAQPSTGKLVLIGCAAVVGLFVAVSFFFMILRIGGGEERVRNDPPKQEEARSSEASSSPEPLRTNEYYVVENTLDVRLAPNQSGSITNRLYRQQKLEVYETKNGWARISQYYDGAVEQKSGPVARWVLLSGLGKARPKDLPQPSIQRDARIDKDAIPKVGENGLSERDVRILYQGAMKLLGDGTCSKIEYGDKSVNKPNTYYVNCGGNTNHFFQPSDLK